MSRRAVMIVLAYAGCCLVWGSTWLVAKLALDDLPPFYLAAARHTVAFALLTPIALPPLLREKWDGRSVAVMAAVGVFSLGLTYGFLVLGQRLVSSGLAAVLFATYPLWVTLLGRLIAPSGPLQRVDLLAGGLGLMGVAIIQLPALQTIQLSAPALYGSALCIVAAVVCAAASCAGKRWLSQTKPTVSTWIQSAVGAGTLWMLHGTMGAATAPVWSTRAILCVFYLALFGTVIAYLLFYWLLARLSLAAIGAIPLLDTLVAICLGAVALHERLEWKDATGGVLILLATALASRVLQWPRFGSAQTSEA